MASSTLTEAFGVQREMQLAVPRATEEDGQG